MSTFQTLRFNRRHDDAAPAGERRCGDVLMRALINEIDCGVMVCAPDGTISFANQTAQQETGRHGSGQDAAIVLNCNERDTADLHAAIRQAATKGRRQLLSLRCAERRLMVSVTPLRGDDDDDARVMLMLGRRASCSPLVLELLGAAHGLTLAERRVLAGLLSEAMPREIADTLGIKVSTVRTQISSIRMKFGVRSIEALLLRASEVPPMAAVVRSSTPVPWHGQSRPLAQQAAMAV